MVEILHEHKKKKDTQSPNNTHKILSAVRVFLLFLGLTMNKQQEAAVKQCMFSYTVILYYINIQKWPKHMKSFGIM
jgi:hypothetical protein